MTVVLLCYLWLDRWEPEPPRLLVFAFLWGASVAVIVSVVLEVVAEAVINPAATVDSDTSPFTVAIGAPLIEEAAKGAVSADHDDRPPPQRAQFAHRLPGLRGPGGGRFRLDRGHLLHRQRRIARRVAGHRRVAPGHGALRAPAVHDVHGHRGVFRAAAAQCARQGRLHPARLCGRGPHARAVERLGAVRLRGLPRCLRGVDGADLRAGDHPRRPQSPPRAGRRRGQAARDGRGRRGRPDEAAWLGSMRNRKQAIDTAIAVRWPRRPASQSRASRPRSSSWRSSGIASTAASATIGCTPC